MQYLVVEPSDHLFIALQLSLALLQLGFQAADLILNSIVLSTVAQGHHAVVVIIRL